MSDEPFPIPPTASDSGESSAAVPSAPDATRSQGNGSGVGPETPWLGLRSFTEETRPYFFGRNAEVQDLFERIVHKPLTVLFGQSGLGKTSILHAALVPRLREAGYLPVSLRLDHTVGAPGLERQMLVAFRNTIFRHAQAIVRGVTKGQPAHSLADPSLLDDAFAKSGYAHLKFPKDIESLWLLLHDPQYGYLSAPEGAAPIRPVFLFDQFEEIFTLGERPERRADSLAFRDALACLVENRAPEAVRQRVETDDDLAERLDYQARPAKVLLTLREDFLHVLERWRRQIPSLMDNRFELRLLTGPQALQAVVEPGRLRGPGQSPIISEETGAAIVRFVAGTEPGVPLAEIDAVPPLLSLICSELNARRFDASGRPREETIQPDQLRGRSEDILQDFYQKSFQEVSSAVRDLVEDRLLSADGFRESLALDSAHRILENDGMGALTARAAVSALVDRRLLVVEERGGVRRVELTHDVLTGVARASRDKREEIRAAERAKAQQAAAEARVAEQRRQVRRARLQGIGFGLLALFSLCALLWAMAQRGEAITRGEQALREEAKAKAAESQAKASSVQAQMASRQSAGLLCQASLSDVATAKNLLGKGNWREAVAYLGRALKYDPDSQLPRSWLWSEIVYGRGDRSSLPQCVLTHEERVWSAAYSPDGTRIVTACGEYGKPGYAQQWEAATGKPIGEPIFHGSVVVSAAYSLDGMRIVTACGEWDKPGYAQQWEAATGRPIGEPVFHESGFHSTSYSPDGTRIVTACGDQTARQWEAASGEPIGELMRHESGVESAFYSPDGTRIVTACLDHTARQWEAASGKPVGEIMRHESVVNSASYSPDGTRIVTACGDHTARQWEAASGKPIGEIMRHGDGVNSASYSSDGLRIVTACDDKTATQWEADSGKSIGEPMRHECLVNSVAYSPDGTRIVTASCDHTARLWEAASNKSIGEPLRHESEVNSAAYSPDGQRIVTACGGYGKNGYAQQWEAGSGQPIGKPLHHGFYVLSAAYSPDGIRIVTASLDKTARQWEAATGRPIGAPMQHDEWASSAVYSPDGTRIVTACGREDKPGYAQQWETGSGQPIGEPLRHEDAVSSAAYSPDGTRIVTASSDKTARQWEAATGRPIGEPMRHESVVNSAAYGPDGQRIVTACGEKFKKPAYAQQWEAATGQPIGEPISHEDMVGSAVYSPDGTRILTASHYGKMARQWETATGRPIGAPMINEESLYSAAYSPDGTRIVTVCGDETARQWEFDPPTRSPPHWLDSLLQAASGYRFAPSGELLALSGAECLALRLHLSRELEKASSQPPDDTRWLALARWFVAPAVQRLVSPGSALTNHALAKRELTSGQEAGIRNALVLVPDLPLVHVALAAFEKNAIRADFLRRYELRHLPPDAATRLAAVRMLDQQKQPQLALDAARAVTKDEPKNAGGWRWVIALLHNSSDHRQDEARQASETLAALPDATAEELSNAGLLCIEQKLVPRGRELLRQAAARFPNEPAVYQCQGRAFIVLGSPAEALAAFQKCGALTKTTGEPPTPDFLAGLAASCWLTGDKPGAVAACEQLIAIQKDYADKKWVAALHWSDAEKAPLLAALAETLRQHPELTPKPQT